MYYRYLMSEHKGGKAQAVLRKRLAQLRKEHSELDTKINKMSKHPYTDQLQLRRMKMRKLQLKDTISRLESQLIPDLDA